MAASYTQYFIGIPLSQIEYDNFHCGYIMHDLFNMKEDIENSDDYELEHKIYNINPDEYINSNGDNLHSDTIIFLKWIQENKNVLQEQNFDLQSNYNGCGDTPVIFGKYISLGFGDDPYQEAGIVKFDKINDVKNELVQFSNLLNSLNPVVLDKFYKDDIINIWSNSHST